MTSPDPLKAAEDAARDAIFGRMLDKRGPNIREELVLDKYHDAIIARRDAEVAALVEALETIRHHAQFAVDGGGKPELNPAWFMETVTRALAPFTKETGQ